MLNSIIGLRAIQLSIGLHEVIVRLEDDTSLAIEQVPEVWTNGNWQAADYNAMIAMIFAPVQRCEIHEGAMYYGTEAGLFRVPIDEDRYETIVLWKADRSVAFSI